LKLFSKLPPGIEVCPKPQKALLHRSMAELYLGRLGFFSPAVGLNKGCFYITAYQQRLYTHLFAKNFACQRFGFSTSADGFACFAAVLIIDTM